MPPPVAEVADRIAQQGPTRVEGEFEFGQFKSQASGTVDLAGRRSRLSSPVAGIGDIDSVTIGSHAYFRLPTTFYKLEKPWIDIDLADPPKTGAAVQIVPLASNGPISILEHLRGVVAARKIGSESVRGKPATHYEVTLDLKRAAANAPADAKSLVTASINRTIQALGGRTTTKTDLWIGDDGTLLRQRSALAFGGQTYSYDLNYLGRSDDLIMPPPKSETVDAKKV